MPVDDDREDDEPKQDRHVEWALAGPMGDYPGLRHFFGAYLHEDWPSEFEGWPAAVEQFTSESSAAEVAEVRKDLRALVDAGLTDAQLDELMAGLQCGLTVEAVGGSWVAWAAALNDDMAGKGHHDG